jgi:TonB-linked SusC/RagA family outer membrane protein
MRNLIFSLLALILLPAYMSGQVIKGKVLDSQGMAIPGAMVVATESRTSTDTDFDGNFELKGKVGEPLKISMVGFEAVTINSTSTPMSIVLKESEDTALKEVVVIGYGTRKKIDNTSAVNSIKSEEITKMKVMNASQAIQGKAAGVQVSTSDAPGSTPSIVIRGAGTALGGRNPLYVVDGMPTENINNINTNDITSYEILKDASALAIYGTRGANGVIMITTKAGKGKLTVELESFVGFRTPLKKVRMANSDQYISYNNIASSDDYPSGRFALDQPYNTNWLDEITRTGTYTQNNLAISGSTETIKYFLSVGNYEEKGILNGSDYGRTTIRNNNEYKISDRLKLTQNLSVSTIKNRPMPLSAFSSAYRQSPLVPVRFPSGKYGVPFINEATGIVTENGGKSFNNVGNPVAQLDYTDEQQQSVILQGGLKLDYEISKSLKFTSQFNAEYYTYKQYNYVDNVALWLAADPTRTQVGYPKDLNINTLTRGRDEYFNWNLSNYLTYNKVFGNIHDIEVTAGMESNVNGTRQKLTIDRKNVYPNSNYWSLENVNVAGTVTGYKDEALNQRRLASYFGRFQYKLMDRYLLTGTVRRDGSSQFAKDQRWGTFPSVGLGWIATKESFLSDIKGLDLLKLRGSWGRLGNQNVPLNTQILTSGVDIPGFGSGTTINSQIDPNLGWEIVEELSGGFDFELLNNRLKGSFDAYSKNTTNTILNVKPYSTSGITVPTPAHVGEVSNKGYEIALRWDDRINDNFSYWVGGNFSHNKNELTSLKNVQLSPVIGGSLSNGQNVKLLDNRAIGQPLGSFYMYEYAGVDPDSGEMLYYKANGEKVAQGGLDELNDKKYVGSLLPTINYGITLGANYKNFDFSVDGYGTGGAKVYNGKKAQRFGGENVEASLTSNYGTSSTPLPFNTTPYASTFYLESADFFRINNITLGYKLPLRENQFISFCRIYVNAINPFITQKFSGFSPDITGDGKLVEGTQGVELDAYPSLRSFVIGANLKF